MRSQLDLDVDARGQVEPHQRVDRLRRRLVDVDEPLVRADLEVLARVLVLERRADHAVDVLLGRERDGTGHGRAGALRRLDDRLRGEVQLRVVVALEADSDLLLCHVGSGPSASLGARAHHHCEAPEAPGSQVSLVPSAYLRTLVTAPAPTVRPPSRMAKRRPSSIAIGWISVMRISALSPGMHISTPSLSCTVPVTSVVRK